METTRKSALAKGETQYFTGKACVKNHTAPRRAKTGECLTCRAEALVLWRQKHPERVKQHNQTQYENHADVLKARSRDNHWADVGRARAKLRAYQKQNLHIFAKAGAKRKAAKINRTPAWLTEDDHWIIQQAYELAALRTKMFGFNWEVDHVLPLQGKMISGLHVPTNLQVIPATLNRQKNNRYEVVL